MERDEASIPRHHWGEGDKDGWLEGSFNGDHIHLTHVKKLKSRSPK